MHADWACRYITRFGVSLVPLPPATKAPTHAEWNTDERLISSVERAREFWARHPDHGMGVCLEPSGLVSLDPDFLPGARTILLKEGINLDSLIASTPTIVGRAPRLMFRAPEQVALGRKAIVWPAQNEGDKPVTVLEFRAGRVQDVLPPSIHPSTQRPYEWRTPPGATFPAFPDELLALWTDFETFARRARNLCPWARPEPEQMPARPRIARARTGPSVIAAFNDAHDVTSILAQQGYQKAGKRRFKSPDGKNMAGVVVLDDGKIFCHHMSDTLADGKAHDAFDLYAHFAHAGDVHAAVKAAAHLLGMDGQQRA